MKSNGFLIHEAAEAANLCCETLRRLEKRGVISSRRDRNGWRRFDSGTIEKLRSLYACSHEGGESSHEPVSK